MKGTIHLVYPHGHRISCPDAIGRHVAEALRAQGYRVATYDWDDLRLIRPVAEDVLIGHPHPWPWTVFRRSAQQDGWRRVLLLSPFNHDLRQVAFLEPVIRSCDLFLAISGNYWFSTIARSKVAHWEPKIVHLDLAVDVADFPPVKRRFNPSGRRRFLYVGHSGWPKNVKYLSEIASRMPDAEFAWIGTGPPIRGLRPLGFQDFRTEGAQKLVGGYDFLITVGIADANPATILEAMAWGLIPICTPESGYSGYEGIINIPLNDADAVVGILRRYLSLPDADLCRLQAANWDVIGAHFNWDRFVQQVIDAIESSATPHVAALAPNRRWQMAFAEVTSPRSWLSPSSLRQALRVIATKRGSDA
ncbi:MAG: hypothetical protein M3Z54_04325 [Gemmatimonadota bacterium]|nr:hypothetical protein [Gemmatimonadota bacterium]